MVLEEIGLNEFENFAKDKKPTQLEKPKIELKEGEELSQDGKLVFKNVDGSKTIFFFFKKFFFFKFFFFQKRF